MKTICFCAIVKNEADVIIRCLETVKKLMDYWIIIDTGSTDGTQNIIKDYLKDIPGELLEKPWKDFATCRNYYVEAAAHKTDYILHQDADEVMIFNENFDVQKFKESLDQDVYGIIFHMNIVRYIRRALFKNDNKRKYISVVHETLVTVDGPETHGVINDFYQTTPSDGSRSVDNINHKFLKDALIFRSALDDPSTDPKFYPRYTFYLANSYRDSGNYAMAIREYNNYLKIVNWNEEAYMACYHSYKIGVFNLQKNPDDFVHYLHKGMLYSPNRLEIPYLLIQYLVQHNQCELAYRFGNHTLKNHNRNIDFINTLFYEEDIHNYLFEFEYTIACFYANKIQESLTLSLDLLSRGIPEHIKDALIRNIKICKQHLNIP